MFVSSTATVVVDPVFGSAIVKGLGDRQRLITQQERQAVRRFGDDVTNKDDDGLGFVVRAIKRMRRSDKATKFVMVE